jgi:hypothetical protein
MLLNKRIDFFSKASVPPPQLPTFGIKLLLDLQSGSFTACQLERLSYTKVAQRMVDSFIAVSSPPGGWTSARFVPEGFGRGKQFVCKLFVIGQQFFLFDEE